MTCSGLLPFNRVELLSRLGLLDPFGDLMDSDSLLLKLLALRITAPSLAAKLKLKDRPKNECLTISSQADKSNESDNPMEL